MARFVLVHGAFGGAWAWRDTAPLLEAAGHTVTAIDLPGAGEDQTPVAEVTLDSYATRICETLASAPEPALLVGHSMGGVAITQAAARCPERISLLVFVAAFMPRDGQSLLDLTQLPEGAGDEVQANIVVEGDPPVASMPDPNARRKIMPHATEEQLEYMLAHQRTQPVVPFATPVSIPPGALDGLGRVYVRTTEDRAIRPALQERMIRENPCVEVVTIETDLSPTFTAPQELVAALNRFAELAAA